MNTKLTHIIAIALAALLALTGTGILWKRRKLRL